MKIGVLGSTGFVGQNLMAYLRSYDYECVPGSRRVVGPHYVDATNAARVRAWIEGNQITHVINLAAECGGIGRNRRSPADLWQSTQMISAATFEACEAAGVEKLVQLGSVCGYSAETPVPFKETDLMRYGPPEPTNMAYGIAKLSSLYGAQAYHQQHGLNVCCLIVVNMYGPHDDFSASDSHVVPAMIMKTNLKMMDSRVPLMFWGSGAPTRELLHVRDFCRAAILAVKSDHESANDGTIINIGNGRDITMRALASKICDIMGCTSQPMWDSSMPDGQMERRLDISLAKEVLGYKPAVHLDDGLRETINWFHAHLPVPGALRR